MTTLRIPINPKIIAWAISHGEKSEADLRQKYRLDRWENPKAEHDNPTFKQVQDFSRDTRIPFNYFFKADIPHEENAFVKFRTINNTNNQPSRRLIDTIHAMASRQEWMKQYLLDQNDQTKFKFLNIINDQMSPKTVAKDILKLLDLTDTIGLTMTDDAFFNILRTKISTLGILVMQSGIVGTNTRRSLDVAEFRAFVLIDSVTPLIFINSADSKKAKIFSLIHELIHALLGRSEILNVSPEDNMTNERWINEVTINILLPAKDVRLNLSQETYQKGLPYLSKKFHTSLVATAIRAVSLNSCKHTAISWAKQEQSRYLKLKQSPSGGNFYNTAISRVDRHFANAVINNEADGNLAVATAASMLGITLKTYDATVDRILEMA